MRHVNELIPSRSEQSEMAINVNKEIDIWVLFPERNAKAGKI